jgi:hypothetical protein
MHGFTCKDWPETKKPAMFAWRAFHQPCGWILLNSGSPNWTRTSDLRINSPSLYQLSYQGIIFQAWFLLLSKKQLNKPSPHYKHLKSPG